MSRTGESLVYSNSEGSDATSNKADRISEKQWQQRALNILLLVILLGLFVLGFNGVIAYDGDVIRANFIVQGTHPIPVLEMRPAHGEIPLVAIVAHGFAGSKDMMTSMGVELAHAGVTTYLLDFPGHGASTIAARSSTLSQFNRQDNVTTISDVVNYARLHTKTIPHPKIILIGLEMGAVAVDDYVTNHSGDDDLISTILISPNTLQPLTLTEPRNVLMLIGQNDSSTILSNREVFLHSGCNLANNQKTATGCGSPTNGTGRRVVVLQGLNQVTIVNSSSTFQEMLNWLDRIEPQIKTNAVHADTRLFWFLLGVAGIVLAMFPLCALLVEIFAIYPLPRPLQGTGVLLYNICLVIGIATAIAILYAWQPFNFVATSVAGYISGYLFISAIIAGALILIIHRKLPIPSFKQAWRQILLGIILAAFLYCTLGELTTFAWQHLTLSMPRLWRFLLVFLLVLPISLLDEGINRGYQERGRLRAIASSLGFKALLLGGLFAAFFFTPGLDFLTIVWPLIILFLLVLGSFCTQLYSSGRAALAGAILSALLLAWCMSTTFPIT